MSISVVWFKRDLRVADHPALALAAAGLMIEDWETVLAATATLHEGETVAVPALLLRACGQQGAGNEAASHELFQRAFVSMPEELVAGHKDEGEHAGAWLRPSPAAAATQ